MGGAQDGLLEVDVIPAMHTDGAHVPCMRAACSGPGPGGTLDGSSGNKKASQVLQAAYLSADSCYGRGDSSLLRAPGARLIPEGW